MKWVRQRGAAALVLFLVLGLMGLASLRTKRHRKAIGDRETIECGVLRAKVKSGTDANAPGINLVATPTTIAALTPKVVVSYDER